MTIVRKSFIGFLVVVFSISIFAAPRARAEVTLGNALLTVGLSTVAGAVLGASTLPFYSDPGSNTQNIFYGAAIGAVIGVFISAYAGVQEGPNFDDAGLFPKRSTVPTLNEDPAFRFSSEWSSSVIRSRSFGAGTQVAWSPVTTVRF